MRQAEASYWELVMVDLKMFKLLERFRALKTFLGMAEPFVLSFFLNANWGFWADLRPKKASAGLVLITVTNKGDDKAYWRQ